MFFFFFSILIWYWVVNQVAHFIFFPCSFDLESVEAVGLHSEGASALAPDLRPISICSIHHDLGAGEQFNLHGLVAAADHAGGHPKSRRPECPWPRHGEEERSAGPQHYAGPGGGTAAQRWKATIQLRQPHHVCHKQLAKEENDPEWNLPVDLWQFPLLQGGRQRLEGKSSGCQVFSFLFCPSRCICMHVSGCHST